MRLIDADELYEKIKNVYIASIQLLDNSSSAYASCLDVIKNAPTIDAVEHKHGHWIDLNDCDEIYGDLYKCPFCENIIVTGGIEGKPDNYCGNCGAKMNEVIK